MYNNNYFFVYYDKLVYQMYEGVAYNLEHSLLVLGKSFVFVLYYLDLCKEQDGKLDNYILPFHLNMPEEVDIGEEEYNYEIDLDIKEEKNY